MTRIYKILRAILVSLLAIAIVVPAALYILLSTSWAQEKLKNTAEDVLTELLDTEVSLQRVDVAPFNRVRIVGLAVKDDFDSTAVRVSDIAARFELMHFLQTGKIVVDYVALDSLSASLYRDSIGAPLNIDKIIKKLSTKDPDSKPSTVKLAINTVIISDSRVSYDVLSKPVKAGVFDASHIHAEEVEVVAYLPRLGNDSVRVDLEHLSLRESNSNFTVNNITTNVVYTPSELTVAGLTMELPNSLIQVGPIEATYSKPAELAEYGRSKDVELQILSGSYISPADLKAFVSQLSEIDNRYYVEMSANGSLQQMNLNNFALEDRRCGLSVKAKGSVSGLNAPSTMTFENTELELRAMRGSLDRFPTLFAGNNSKKASDILRQLGSINTQISVDGSRDNLNATINATSEIGQVNADALVCQVSEKAWDIEGTARINNFEVGKLTGNSRLGVITSVIDGNVSIVGDKVSGECVVETEAFRFDEHTFQNVQIEASMNRSGDFAGAIAMADTAGVVDLKFTGRDSNQQEMRVALNGMVRELQLNTLGVKGRFAPYNLTADIDIELSGNPKEWLNGYADIKNLHFTDNEAKTLDIKHIRAESDNTRTPNTVTIESDFINGSINGRIHPVAFWSQCRDIIGHVFPAITGYHHLDPANTDTATDSHSAEYNDFDFDFEIANAENLSSFLDLPIQVVYPVSISGMFEFAKHGFNLTIDAPYLQQGDKIIENTAFHAGIDGNEERGVVYVTSTIPTQKGVMALSSYMTASNDRLDTKINWTMERDKPIDGILSFSTLIERDAASGSLSADIAVNPGQIIFGTDTWQLSPSHILISPKDFSVNNFAMTTGEQSLEINGQANDEANSEMQIKLNNLELISIFETLDINNALIGGRATGTFHAREVFTATPQLWTDNLYVKNIGYNYCVMGDGQVKAWWDNDKKAFTLDADIIEPGGRLSHIYGDILPAAQALDISFDADRVKVGFMAPFMSAFSEGITGYASGHARLFGTFKDIDLEGDIYADSLGLKIGFTNTWYYATDSVHIRPGIINIDNITIADSYGNTALLNGYVKHDYFHLPEFQFRLTDANHLLCYDVPAKKSPDWYGHVFGNGSAMIKGAPGYVNIDVNMLTTEGSTFTFVLSDTEEADDYTFITFRNRDVAVITDSIIEVDRLPAAVREYRDRMRAKAAQADTPSEYNMNIQVDINNDANIILVMDPIGGDRIKSYGNGNLRMTYNSTGNELHMYGTYAIERGSYNFTLQDIIVKDFVINDGSSITFTGDPYAARLDIKALYPVNANLSDLDESFLQDKELNRTNVPVNAVLMAQGDMRQPDISFDLEFPTLNSDVYRKVHSIISTDDMMNRQIIYLLALNRFYTPVYMSTTKGNELFSVASSTIASQLSSMLGKLSENWSIAPNLRSDRGDFSDVEVDVALSSNLLNNRLRLNGNFGYRDKSLNNNQFIGDFDIEYLLNRRGTWRLKAYNRYNDQSYYLRTAQTTQGVGVMFKRDFDKFLNFLKPGKKDREEADTTATSTNAPVSVNLSESTTNTQNAEDAQVDTTVVNANTTTN